MKRKQLGFTANELLAVMGIAVVAIGAAGWVWNIVKLAGSDFGVFTGLLIVRVVGIFVPPVGAIVGYF